MNRRLFLGTTVAAAAAAAPSRSIGKVETLFKTPGPHPNGLQATKEGLWIIDQANNRVYLVNYSDGKIIREFLTEADRASGITFDGEALWLASTYSRELIRTDAATGKALGKFFTPGGGVIYKMAGDPPQRRSALSKPPAETPAPAKPSLPPSTAAGTGAHGLEWRDGKLWVAVPPSRTIYKIDPSTWTIEKKFSTSGNRPHGLGWEGKYLWCADSNHYGFFKHDPDSGEVVEKIMPHGATIWNKEMWYCDDVGVVCKFKLG
jgi:DNA-binding beta-propeller fold protein YncE